MSDIVAAVVDIVAVVVDIAEIGDIEGIGQEGMDTAAALCVCGEVEEGEEPP